MGAILNNEELPELMKHCNCLNVPNISIAVLKVQTEVLLKLNSEITF